MQQLIASNINHQVKRLNNQDRLIDVVRSIVFTSTRSDTPVDSLRSNMINDFHSANYEVHRLITSGESVYLILIECIRMCGVCASEICDGLSSYFIDDMILYDKTTISTRTRHKDQHKHQHQHQHQHQHKHKHKHKHKHQHLFNSRCFL